MWKKIRTPLAILLVPLAAFQVGKNLGFREGIQVKYGGPGTFNTATVEWQDVGMRKVVLYLNDGPNGYAFWFQLKEGFVHYSYAAKVFVCNNEDDVAIHETLDKARDWCRNEWDGGDTRILGGELKPRSDDGDKVAVTDFDEREWHLILADRAELARLRQDCSDLAVERDALRKKLSEICR